MNQFRPGEAVHVYLTSCASSSGEIVEPTPIRLTYWPPTTQTPTIATTSGSAVPISTGGSSGAYFCEIVPTTAQVGVWDYRWSSTGAYKLTQWGSFRVIDPPRST